MSTYIPESSIIEANEHYTAYNARYAKNMIAVHLNDSDNGFKGVAGIYASKVTDRYSHREQSYMMSKSQFKRFSEDFGKWLTEKSETFILNRSRYEKNL